MCTIGESFQHYICEFGDIGCSYSSAAICMDDLSFTEAAGGSLFDGYHAASHKPDFEKLLVRNFSGRHPALPYEPGHRDRFNTRAAASGHSASGLRTCA